MIALDQLERRLLSEHANELIEEWMALAIEQDLPVTAENLALWTGQRIHLYSSGPLAKRASATVTVAALAEIRRALGLAGATIAVVSVEHGGVRSIVAEIRDAASCTVLDCSGRKRLGDVAGRSADERALAEAMAICRVRGWQVCASPDGAG